MSNDKYLVIFPMETTHIGDCATIICDEEFRLFSIPEGYSLQIGDMILYNDFVLTKGCMVQMVVASQTKWLAMAVMGPVFISSFEIIPPKDETWTTKAINFFKSFRQK